MVNSHVRHVGYIESQGPPRSNPYAPERVCRGRAGAMVMMVGSGLTVAFLLYRRGIHVRICHQTLVVSRYRGYRCWFGFPAISSNIPVWFEVEAYSQHTQYYPEFALQF